MVDRALLVNVAQRHKTLLRYRVEWPIPVICVIMRNGRTLLKAGQFGDQ